MKNLDILRNTYLSSSKRRAPDPNDWGPRFNAHWGCWIIFFSRGACDANIAIIANFGYFVKNSILKVIQTFIFKRASDILEI